MSKEFSCEYAMSAEVAKMCVVAKGPNHGPAPIPEEGKMANKTAAKAADKGGRVAVKRKISPFFPREKPPFSSMGNGEKHSTKRKPSPSI